MLSKTGFAALAGKGCNITKMPGKGCNITKMLRNKSSNLRDRCHKKDSEKTICFVWAVVSWPLSAT